MMRAARVAAAALLWLALACIAHAQGVRETTVLEAARDWVAAMDRGEYDASSPRRAGIRKP